MAEGDGDPVKATMRLTAADLALLGQARRSRTYFADENLVYFDEYRRQGTSRSYYLRHRGARAELVTRRAKRLLAMGLVEHTRFAGVYGPTGDLVLTEEGRRVLSEAAGTDPAEVHHG